MVFFRRLDRGKIIVLLFKAVYIVLMALLARFVFGVFYSNPDFAIFVGVVFWTWALWYRGRYGRWYMD